MLCNTDFRADDEFLFIRLLGIIHNSAGRADIVRLADYLRLTLRMNQQFRIRMKCARLVHIALLYTRVNRTSALQQLDLFLRHLIRDILSQIAVRNEQNFFRFHLLDYAHRRRRGHTDVADGFQIRSGVDIRNHCVIRKLFFDGRDQLAIHLLGHRASGNRIGKIDGFFRGKDFDRLRHKSNAAHHHVFLRDVLRFDTERIGISYKIRNLRDFTRLIAVRKDTHVFFFLQSENLFLNLSYHE